MTAVFAILGLNAWRKKTIGQRKIQISEEILLTAFRAQEALEYARHPAGFTTEGQSRPKTAGEPENVERRLNSLFVPIERLNQRLDIFSELDRVRVLSKVYFEIALTENIEELLKTRSKIIQDSEFLIGYLIDHNRSGADIDHDYVKGIEASIRRSFSGEDEIQKEIEECVKMIEMHCIRFLTAA